MLLSSANLYTRTWLTIGKFWNIYGSVRSANRKKYFNYLHLWLLLLFRCTTVAAHQAFPFVTATNGASPCGFVNVRACT